MECRLHDSHVRRWRKALRWRDKAREVYAKHPERERARSVQRKQRLTQGYVVYQLLQMGVPKEIVDARLIDFKREQLTIRRLARLLKKEKANEGSTNTR
jgi:hypothetical protein